jgi:hypothetical protein
VESNPKNVFHFFDLNFFRITSTNWFSGKLTTISLYSRMNEFRITLRGLGNSFNEKLHYLADSGIQALAFTAKSRNMRLANVNVVCIEEYCKYRSQWFDCTYRNRFFIEKINGTEP